MSIRTGARICITLASIASLSGCGLSYDCGTARQTVASGAIRDVSGVGLATVEVSLAEYVHPSFLRLSVGLMGSPHSGGAPLRGHITRGFLVDGNGQTLAEISTGTTTLFEDAVAALNVNLASDADYARVRNALLTTRARVVLETDLPGREHLESSLTDAHDVPANTTQCSPV